ncbi:MAG TPA: hypothetical protein VGC53_09445 [Vicinamibacteria bacterium]|jgi:hypothetical protein
MKDPVSEQLSSAVRLVFVPALISLIVTLWRLTGELLHWSDRFYNPEPGGAGAIVGITWLAPVFGIYFALHLARDGQSPSHWPKALGLGFIGAAVLIAGTPLQALFLEQSFFAGLVYIWVLGLVAASVQFFGWPQLFKTLLVYGLAARLPVILIMALAIQGVWGTHYDARPAGFPEMGWQAAFIWLGLLPQLLFWVPFTIVMGAFFGTPVAAVLHRMQTASRAVSS